MLVQLVMQRVRGERMVLVCGVVTYFLQNLYHNLKCRLPTRGLKVFSFLSYEAKLGVLWSVDPSLSSLSKPLGLGSEDSQIAGVTLALG